MPQPARPGGGRTRSWWLRVVGWSITAGFAVLAVVLLRGRWEEVQASGGLPGVVPFGLAVAVNVVANLVLVHAWRVGIAIADVAVPFGTAARVWSASQLTRLGFAVAPVGARPLLGRRFGISVGVSAVTTLLEIAWLIALSPVLLLATLPAWAGDAPAWRWAGFVGIVPALVAVAAMGWPNAVLDRMRWLVAATPLRRLVGDQALDAAAAVRVPRSTAARWGALYVLNYALRVLAFLILLGSLGVDVGGHLGRAIGAFALGQFVGNLAVLVPGGIGPREGATALVLGPAIGAGPALVLVAAMRLAELAAELLFFSSTRLLTAAPADDGSDPD